MIMAMDDFERLKFHPAAWAVAGVVLAIAIGNARYGAQTGGAIGFIVALSIAVLGVWLPTQFKAAGGVMRVVISVLTLGCFAFTQVAGWRVLGVTMADSAVQRDAKATGRAVAADALKAKREARTKIGAPRAEASIEAEAKLECSKTSARYADGVGPRCTDLRSELAAAKRAAALDKEIADAMAALGSVEQVSGGTPDLEKVASILSLARKVSPEQVGDWLPVFFVFLFDLIGFFGPVLLGLHGGAGHGPGGGGGRRRTERDEDWQWSERTSVAPGFGSDVAAARMRIDGPAAPLRLSAPETAAGGGQSHASAPISVYVGYPGVPTVGQSEAPRASSEAAPQRAPARATLVPRHDIAAVPDAPPADRSAVASEPDAAERPAVDVILTFTSACTLRAPGGLVDFEHLYKRYCRWAGPERAISATAFRRLVSKYAGIAVVDIGGMPHAEGIQLRAAAPDVHVVGKVA